MTGKSVAKLLIMFVFFIIVSAVDLSIIKVSAQTCGPDADAEIVSSIYAKIKANSKLAGQEMHINITSKDRVVKIVGWADSAANRKTIYDYAMATECVTMVNDKGFLDKEPTEEELRTMCVSGTKPCGGLCIPESETCNIGGNTKNED